MFNFWDEADKKAALFFIVLWPVLAVIRFIWRRIFEGVEQ